MQPCTHRGIVNSANECECRNTNDLIHPGVVPLEICMVCPFAETPGDFFHQTSRLLINKQRRGEISQSKKSCGGCGSTKRRKPDQSFDLQFVWPYWAGGAKGDELRFSIRSVEKFFDGRVQCTIIGDKPIWFGGHHIPQRKITKGTPNRGFRDVLTKLWTAANHDAVSDDFIWMMDDIYFMKKFSFEQISAPMAEPFHNASGNTWQRLKKQTMEVLSALGHTTHDYATHLPHYVEREKIKAMFDAFSLHDRVLIWEILYGNTYRESPHRSRPFLTRLYTPISSKTEIPFLTEASVMNHTTSAWNEYLRRFLIELLPDKSPSETDDGKFHRMQKKKYGTVKRRPVETHRDYIESNKTK